MEAEIIQKYGNKVRVRVCGLCWHQSRLLMVNHKGLREGDFWAPPGGGLEFGETLEQVLIREFKEETGLNIAIDSFLFIHEHIQKPLHAIELFYQVTLLSGELKIGNDPETETKVIHDVRWMSIKEIEKIAPDEKHRFFSTSKLSFDWRKIG